MTQADPAAAQAVADTRLQAVARGIQTQVDQRVQRVEQSSAGVRRVTVATRDPATSTCQVYLDGDTSSPAPCRPVGPTVVPVVGAMGWAIQNGSDLLLAATDAGLPQAKLRSTASQIPAGAGVPERFNFNAAGGSVSYDTDNDGTDTMVDQANSRIYVRWPGTYAYGYHWHIVAGGSVSIFADVKLNATLFLPPRYHGDSSSGPSDDSLSDERVFAAGDYIELFITGAGVSFGTSSNELGMSLWMSYRP